MQNKNLAMPKSSILQYDIAVVDSSIKHISAVTFADRLFYISYLNTRLELDLCAQVFLSAIYLSLTNVQLCKMSREYYHLDNMIKAPSTVRYGGGIKYPYRHYALVCKYKK